MRLIQMWKMCEKSKINSTEGRAVIKYLQKKGMTPKEIHEDMVKIFAEDLSSITTKKKWDVEVKQNRVNTKDDPRSGPPKFSTNDKQVSAKEIYEDMVEILAEDLLLLLVGWVLWHINLCRLFNAKSIFIQIISSISNNSV